MKPLKLILILSIAYVFMQCEQQIEVTESLNPHGLDDATISRIAALGFDTKNFPVLKDGDYFTVEGDINIPASYLDEAGHDNGRTEQRRFPNIISCNEVRYITVYNNLPSGTTARSAVSLAMQHWNDITKCDIFLANTNNINNAEIIISKGPLDGGVVGRATMPSGGRPGKYIRLDLDDFNFDYAQWRSTIEHELGHCLGFAHTNGTSSSEIYIPDTPFTDASSMMNSGQGGVVRKLTAGDKKAARLLYNLNFSGRLCN
ncbi:MAG: M57 family metalloprotease [Bacteroidota bacterium]